MAGENEGNANAGGVKKPETGGDTTDYKALYETEKAEREADKKRLNGEAAESRVKKKEAEDLLKKQQEEQGAWKPLYEQSEAQLAKVNGEMETLKEKAARLDGIEAATKKEVEAEMATLPEYLQLGLKHAPLATQREALAKFKEAQLTAGGKKPPAKSAPQLGAPPVGDGAPINFGSAQSKAELSEMIAANPDAFDVLAQSTAPKPRSMFAKLLTPTKK